MGRVRRTFRKAVGELLGERGAGNEGLEDGGRGPLASGDVGDDVLCCVETKKA